MKKNGIIALIVVLIIGLTGMYLASPYLAASSLRNAAMESDSDKLESLIDFPSVRESLKSQLTVAMMAEMENDPEMKDNPFAGLGAMMLPTMVEKMVDAFVTPDGVAAMLRGQKPNEKAAPSLKKEIEFTTSYVNLDRFRVAMRNTEINEDGPSLVFERRGFASWKLIKIELPSGFLSKPNSPN